MVEELPSTSADVLSSTLHELKIMNIIFSRLAAEGAICNSQKVQAIQKGLRNMYERTLKLIDTGELVKLIQQESGKPKFVSIQAPELSYDKISSVRAHNKFPEFWELVSKPSLNDEDLVTCTAFVVKTVCTQDDFARWAGMSSPTLTRILKNNPLSPDKRERAYLLLMAIKKLFEGSPEEPAPSS